MGHERLPSLPKSEKWQKILSDVAATASNECTAEEVIQQTAKAIDSRFRRLHLDPSIQDTFHFLIILTVAARSKNPKATLSEYGINLQGKSATPLNLAQAMSSFMRREAASIEYLELAKCATTVALAKFYRQESSQLDLFGPRDDPFIIWGKASDGRGFCLLARHFFSAFTTQYFKYFLDREASAVLPTVEAREAFQTNLEAHVDRITRHSFEVSKITQSFAAGWYNKKVIKETPTRKMITGFLSIAFNKIRDSLVRREVALK
jgi:hypothetical protein